MTRDWTDFKATANALARAQRDANVTVLDQHGKEIDSGFLHGVDEDDDGMTLILDWNPVLIPGERFIGSKLDETDSLYSGSYLLTVWVNTD